MSSSVGLKIRWDSITSNIPSDVSIKWWSKVEKEYSNDLRKYHNLQHLSQMFDHFDKCSNNLNSTNAVAFAIFFHDLVYNPKASDNEERSADLFKEFAQEAGLPLDSPLYNEVNNLILSTKTHMTEEHKESGALGTEDKHYFLDFDMSVLGSSSEEYLEYAEQIRDEYNFFPTFTYNGLRSKVLKSFLQIPNIFATEEFRKKFEDRARQNIEDEISRLEAC